MASAGGNPKDMVNAPAIALLVAGCLYLLGGLCSCGYGGFLFTSGPPTTSSTTKTGDGDTTVTAVTSVGAGIFDFIAGPILIFGAMQMRKLKMYGLAMTSSILGMIPCTGCCLVGLPIGIWALIILLKPEVKSAFS
jgi:hypothetical protein